jgi:hypothetical protein
MMNKLLLPIFLLLFSALLFSQTRKLPRNLSNGLDNEIAPKISADGNAIAFLYKANRGGDWKIYYATKKSGKWGRADELPGVNKHISLVQFAGFCLNDDGSVLYYSSKKHGGVGGYDLWRTERIDDERWTTPTNLYKPINSAENECSPSISADGNFMYFTRISTVNKQGGDCGEIYVSARRGKAWSEAMPLPFPINTGCENSPFIHPDGKTLYFASKRAGGKGGLDLYLSKISEKGKWSKPVALEVLNTTEDDQFMTMDAREKIVYYAQKNDDSYDLYETIVVEKYRAEPLLKIRLRLKDEDGDRVDGYLRIKHPGSSNYLFTKKIEDTDHQTTIYLSGKGPHDFTIYGADDNHFFFSESFNMDELTSYKSVRREVALAHVKKGFEYPIHLPFDRDSVFSAFAKEELKRVKRIVSKHSDKKFIIEMRVPFVERLPVYDTIRTVVQVQRDSILVDTIVTSIVEVVLELTPEELLHIGQMNTLRVYCEQIGLTEKRVKIIKSDIKFLKEEEFVVLID